MSQHDPHLSYLLVDRIVEPNFSCLGHVAYYARVVWGLGKRFGYHIIEFLSSSTQNDNHGIDAVNPLKFVLNNEQSPCFYPDAPALISALLLQNLLESLQENIG